MINKNLFLIGLLSFGALAVSGCAQKMAKSDDAMTPPTEQATAAESTSSSQDQAAAQDSAVTAPADDAAEKTAALPSPLPEGGAAPAQEPTATQKEVAVALLPLPSKEVMDTITKMTHHPRVRYLSRTAQYDYYVGGRLDAKYDINKNQFVIKNQNAADPDAVTCEYSKDGEMISKNKKIPSKVIGECNNLVNELSSYLSE